MSMKKRDWNGWERLICPYFTEACRNILGHYLKVNGFTEKDLTRGEGLIFSHLTTFLEISYELEIVPQSLTMAIGMNGKEYNKNYLVPCWYLLPRGHWAHQADAMGFRNESELKILLARFRDEIIEPYVKPLWLNTNLLKKTNASFLKWWDAYSKVSRPFPR